MRVTVPVTEDQKHLFLESALSQVGKPYDKWDIAGFVFGRDWRDPQAWICSELEVWCLERARIIPPVFLAVNRMDPGMAAMRTTAIPGASWYFIGPVPKMALTMEEVLRLWQQP